MNCCEVTLLLLAVLMCNKALLHFTGGSMMIMCGGSPLMEYECMFHFCVLAISVVGENTQERRRSLYSRSPLSEPVYYFRYCFCYFVIRVGEIHRVAQYYTLVLPSTFLLFVSGLVVGENTQVGVFYNTLVLPTMNRKMSLFKGLNFNHFFDHILGHQFFHGLPTVVWYT